MTAQLYRFVAGKRSLSLASAAKVTAALGMVLVPRRRRRRESVLGLYWIQFPDPCEYLENRQSLKRFCNPSHDTLRCRFAGFPRGKTLVFCSSEVAFISRGSLVQVQSPLLS